MLLLWHEKAPNTKTHRPFVVIVRLSNKFLVCCGSSVNGLSFLLPKGLNFVQWLSKSLKVVLKNAKHKITNKLKAVTPPQRLHYIRLLKAYVTIIGWFWQGKFFNAPPWNWRGQSVFMWPPRMISPPWCSSKIIHLRRRVVKLTSHEPRGASSGFLS